MGWKTWRNRWDLYSKAVRQIGQENPLNWIGIFWQAVLNLLGKTTDPCHLIGDVYNEAEALPLSNTKQQPD